MSINSLQKINFKQLLTKKELIIVVSFFLLLTIIFYLTFFTANYYQGKSPKVLLIKPGENFSQVTEKLYQTGVIPSRFNFKVVGWILGANTRIKPARYKIQNGLNYIEIVELLVSGAGDKLKEVKLYDGISIKGIAIRLKQEGIVDDSLFIFTVKDKKVADSLGVNAESLLGYLLPGNYFLYENSTPFEVIKEMLKKMHSFYDQKVKEKIRNTNFSFHQILTLASIVEGETNKPEEMPRIAGVYLNRLKLGMKLQADPTIQFINSEGWKRLGYRDLRKDSPYNTYLYTGLPPGPINNPGKSAILAVLTPEKHRYIFFVADGTGYHKFSENFSQHQKLAREYYRWLNKKK